MTASAYESSVQSMVDHTGTIVVTSSTAMKGSYFQEMMIGILPYVLSEKKHVVLLRETLDVLRTLAADSDPKTAAKASAALGFLRDLQDRQARMCPAGSEFLLFSGNFASGSKGDESSAVLRFAYEWLLRESILVLTQEVKLAKALDQLRGPGQHIAEVRRIAQGCMLDRFAADPNAYPAARRCV